MGNTKFKKLWRAWTKAYERLVRTMNIKQIELLNDYEHKYQEYQRY